MTKPSSLPPLPQILRLPRQLDQARTITLIHLYNKTWYRGIIGTQWITATRLLRLIGEGDLVRLTADRGRRQEGRSGESGYGYMSGQTLDHGSPEQAGPNRRSHSRVSRIGGPSGRRLSSRFEFIATALYRLRKGGPSHRDICVHCVHV